MDALDRSPFVVAPLDVLLVLTALLARGPRDPRWFLEALCQGLGVGAGGTFVVAVVSGLALSSGVLPAFLLLLLGPLAFGLCFALGASGVHLVRFLRQARGWRAPAEDHPSLPRAPAPVSRAHTSSASARHPEAARLRARPFPSAPRCPPRYAQVRSGGRPVGRADLRLLTPGLAITSGKGWSTRRSPDSKLRCAVREGAAMRLGPGQLDEQLPPNRTAWPTTRTVTVPSGQGCLADSDPPRDSHREQGAT